MVKMAVWRLSGETASASEKKEEQRWRQRTAASAK